MKRYWLAAVAACVVMAAAQDAAAQTVLRFGKIPSTVKNVGLALSARGRAQGLLRPRGDQAAVRADRGRHRPHGGGDRQGRHRSRAFVDAISDRGVLKGSQAVGIAGEVGNPVYTLVVRPEIKSYADLKGKTIALSVAADTISITTRKLLAKNGVQDGEFTVKQLVGTPVRYACLKSGECAGVPLGQPNDIAAVKEGFRRLGDTTEAVGNFQFQLIVAQRDWAAANKDKAGAVRARGRGCLPLHPRSEEPRRDRQADDGADRLVGGDRAGGDGALFRARPRGDAAAGARST